ncbi:hypothetical protein JCM11641_001556 [Rhodosporidiobolus odoratus]
MSAPPQPPTAAPPRLQVEQTLEQLLQTLLELGICASDVQDSALEASPNGVASGAPGGLIGRKVTQTIDHLQRLHAQKDIVDSVHIPLEVINLVDAGKNPHQHTKNFIERVSGENMYTNGILGAVSDYRDLLRAQLGSAFPELTEFVAPPTSSADNAGVGFAAAPAPLANGPPTAAVTNRDVKMEDVR